MITREIFQAYLDCKYKAFLKVNGEIGTKSAYETMSLGNMTALREQMVVKFAAQSGSRDIVVNAATLKQGKALLANAKFQDEKLSLCFDALSRAKGPSQIGDHHYLPVLHHDGSKVGRQQKLLLALYGLALARVQGLRPTCGLIAHGSDFKLKRVRLDSNVFRLAEQTLDELSRLHAGGDPPRLTLNRHCHVCEFRQRCRAHAEEADDINLLAGVGEKELKKYNRKGIFTITQLSCTFRPRKRNKRVKRKDHVHYPALQALAIREKKDPRLRHAELNFQAFAGLP